MLENTSLSYNKCKKFSWDKIGEHLEACWVMLDFVVWANDLTLDLGLEAKRIGEGTIWGLMVLDIFIARLSVTAELGWVVSALQREEVYKMSNVLLI